MLNMGRSYLTDGYEKGGAADLLPPHPRASRCYSDLVIWWYSGTECQSSSTFSTASL